MTTSAFLVLVSTSAWADPQKDAMPHETWAQPTYARMLVGFGGAPEIPTANMVLTVEVGHRPFYGALTTGASFSSASDLSGAYTVLTPGVFAKLDLTYLFMSGLWARQPPPNFPVRLEIGSRIGMALSDSFGVTPSYVLIRAEMEPFFDVVVPLDSHHTFSLVGRGAIDSSVSFNGLFRWSIAIGFSYGWGHRV